jgi:hypothetical protein
MVSVVFMGVSVGICGHKALGSLVAAGALTWYFAGRSSPLLRPMKACVQEQQESIAKMTCQNDN